MSLGLIYSQCLSTRKDADYEVIQCSREQNYRPEDCGICHAMLIAKKASGFWEGGKGTRDKARMSRSMYIPSTSFLFFTVP